MNNDQTFLDGRGGEKDAISLGCKCGDLETSSLVMTGRRRRLPRNLQRYKAGFWMGYELLKEERGIKSIVPLEPFAGSILLPKVTSRRDITLLGRPRRLPSVAVTDSVLAVVDLAPPVFLVGIPTLQYHIAGTFGLHSGTVSAIFPTSSELCSYVFHKPVFISDASPKTSAALVAVSLALSSTVTDPEQCSRYHVAI